jgi:hypothetical protein
MILLLYFNTLSNDIIFLSVSKKISKLFYVSNINLKMFIILKSIFKLSYYIKSLSILSYSLSINIYHLCFIIYSGISIANSFIY